MVGVRFLLVVDSWGRLQGAAGIKNGWLEMYLCHSVKEKKNFLTFDLNVSKTLSTSLLLVVNRTLSATRDIYHT